MHLLLFRVVWKGMPLIMRHMAKLADAEEDQAVALDVCFYYLEEVAVL